MVKSNFIIHFRRPEPDHYQPILQNEQYWWRVWLGRILHQYLMMRLMLLLLLAQRLTKFIITLPSPEWGPSDTFFCKFHQLKNTSTLGGVTWQKRDTFNKRVSPASSIETNQINFSLNLGHSMIHGLGILKRIYVKSRCILLKAFWLQIFLHTSFTNAIVDVIKFSGSDFKISK